MGGKTFWIVVAVLLGWWFFTGEGPVAIVRNFIGRGKRLTSSRLNDDGSLVETIDDLWNQVRQATGRDDVSRDAVIVARVIASENPGGTEREKEAIGWVLVNDARKYGWSLQYTVTVKPGTLGKQAGRRYSTAGGGKPPRYTREIHEDDLDIAEGILSGAIPDLTGGATKFIHYTGYRRLEDFLAANPKVQAWIDGGLRPVHLGGVGVLVVFLPAALVDENGKPRNALETQS